MRWIRPSWASALCVVCLMLIYAGAASARTPYRSNPPATEPATSQVSASPTLPIAITPAICTDGTCAKPGPGPADLPSLEDHRYGTALEWVDTPDIAAKEAARDKKLVFLIQISGNFTRQEFT